MDSSTARKGTNTSNKIPTRVTYFWTHVRRIAIIWPSIVGMWVHSGEKLYLCDRCPMTFSDSDYLTSLHRGKILFMWPLPEDIFWERQFEISNSDSTSQSSRLWLCSRIVEYFEWTISGSCLWVIIGCVVGKHRQLKVRMIKDIVTIDVEEVRA